MRLHYHLSYDKNSDPRELLAAIKTLDPSITRTDRTGVFSDPINGAMPLIEVESDINLEKEIHDFCNNEDIDPDNIHPGFFFLGNCYKGPIGAARLRIRKAFDPKALPRKEIAEQANIAEKQEGSVVIRINSAAYSDVYTVVNEQDAPRILRENEEILSGVRTLTNQQTVLPSPNDKTAWDAFINPLDPKWLPTIERTATYNTPLDQLHARVLNAMDGRIIALFSFKNNPTWEGNIEPLMRKIDERADPCGPMAIAILGYMDTVPDILTNKGIEVDPTPIDPASDIAQYLMSVLTPVPKLNMDENRVSYDELCARVAKSSAEATDSILDKIEEKARESLNQEETQLIYQCHHESLF